MMGPFARHTCAGRAGLKRVERMPAAHTVTRTALTRSLSSGVFKQVHDRFREARTLQCSLILCVKTAAIRPADASFRGEIDVG
jgi:glutamine synthetase type III